MDRYLISVCGPNGAGKSTFTRSVLSTLGLPIVDPDLYSSQGVSEIAAGKIAIRLINDYLDRGISFIKESTLTSNFDARIMARAKNLGYANVLIYLTLPSVEASLHRVERRVLAGGHSIPEEAIRRRFYKSRANLEALKDKVDYCYIINAANTRLDPEFQKANKFLRNIGDSPAD